MENQFWEKLLNFFAKENGIKTYGFPHAGIRFFDLRYFLYPEIFNNNNNYLPFRFIEHSLDTKNAFSYLNFKKKNIVKLESLRFLKYSFNKIKHQKNRKVSNVLIYLDIFENNKSEILDIINIYKNRKKFNFYVQPHPTDTDNIKKIYPFINIMNNKFYNELQFSFVISSNNTTAVFEAYYNKIPFLVFLKQNCLNLNPLLNIKKINYFYNEETLSSCIKNISYKNLKKLKQYHYNEPKIPRWKKFIL